MQSKASSTAYTLCRLCARGRLLNVCDIKSWTGDMTATEANCYLKHSILKEGWNVPNRSSIKAALKQYLSSMEQNRVFRLVIKWLYYSYTIYNTLILKNKNTWKKRTKKKRERKNYRFNYWKSIVANILCLLSKEKRRTKCTTNSSSNETTNNQHSKQIWKLWPLFLAHSR